VQKQSGQQERVSTRGENGGGFSTGCPCVKIRPARARGTTESTIGGGRFGGAQRCERGHRSVTDSMAGDVGHVIRPGR
jgi:hypothetical protein